MAEYEMWLVLGSARNWGRGTSFREALGNAVKEAGMTYPMIEAHVYKVEADRELKGEDLWCDDLGTVHYSLDTKMKKLANWKVPKKLSEAYYAFDLEVEEAQWGTIDAAGLND